MRRREKREDIMKERGKEEIDWIAKTDTGKKVRDGEITSFQQLLDSGLPIMEPQAIDRLIPDLKEKLVEFNKTTKVRSAGRVFSFRASVLIGDGNEFIGIGTAKGKEKMPAIRKATNRAKLNLVKVRKGCGSWECTCGAHHSIPFKVEGKSASVRITLMPAPKGTGLVVGSNIKEVFEFVGIKDIWSTSKGSTGTKLNFIKAAIDALSKTTEMKLSEDITQRIDKKKLKEEIKEDKTEALIEAAPKEEIEEKGEE